MVNILHYLMMNSRGLLYSFSGFVLSTAVMWKVIGAKHSVRTTILVTFLMWSIRYFGLNLYVSTWLGSRYIDEIWYNRLMIVLTVLNVAMGIFWINILYAGGLRKNILFWILLEIAVTITAFVPALLIDRTTMKGFSLMEPAAPFDWLVLLYLTLLYCAIIKFASPWIIRYRDWEPRRPWIIDLVLVGYFLLGIYNNISYALLKGQTGMLLFVGMSILTIGYLWAGFFYKENKKAEQTRQKLLRYEHALKVHSRQMIEQSIKMKRYHGMIKQSMEMLSDRIMQMDKSGTAPEVRMDGRKEADPVSAGNEARDLAERYMEGLERHYREITVSKYSDDIGMNELLLASEQKFSERNIPVQIRFHRFHVPDDLSEADLEQLLSWMTDQVLDLYAVNKNMASGQDEEPVIIQGGLVMNEFILLCEYPGQLPSGPDERKLRRIIKRMKADMTIDREEGKVSITIGIPF